MDTKPIQPRPILDSLLTDNNTEIVNNKPTIISKGKELARKMSTTRANVSKVEAAVYALRVRGGEAPPTLLLPSAHHEWDQHQHQHHSDDEGYY